MTAAPALRVGRDARVAAAGMVAVAAVWPLLPAHPSVVCPLRAATGVPCPLCGMTRAVVAAAHGHLLSSLAFNPAGLGVLAVALVALVRPAALARIRLPAWGWVAAFCSLWIWNIGLNPTFHQLFLR